MSVQDNLKVARGFYEEFNKRNFSNVQKTVDDKAQLQIIPLNTKFSGKEGYLQLAQGWANAFPDGQCIITNITAGEDGVVVEFAGRGTQTGTFRSPDGDIMPTGKSVDIPFCDVFKIKNGRIVSYNSYFDTATMLKQLGLIPELKHQ
ncbi:MAG TPA: ester cyclase [Ignavibacteriaceae bacterium]|nr:ester cyclase [Ignavibacteriaceae bacterium]